MSAVSGKTLSWSKHCATPELPLLEGAASELAALGECDLLPAAVVDTLGKLEAETPATGAPQSPDDLEEDVSDEDENLVSVRGKDHVMSPDRRIFIKNGFIVGDQHEEVPRRRQRSSSAPPSVDGSPSDQGQQQAAAAEKQQSAHVPTEGALAAWWCRLHQDGSWMQIIPLPDGRVEEAAIDSELAQGRDAGCMMLWCWLQPEAETGSLTVLPCTTADYPPHQGPFFSEDNHCQYSHEQCSVAASTSASAASTPSSVEHAQATSSEADKAESVISDEDFAPPVPPAGSYQPVWAPGPGFAKDLRPTTLVLSNLPAQLEQEDLLEVLDRLEMSGFYDFVYLLPKDGCSCRSAVVNLTRHTWGLRLAAFIHGKASWGEGLGDGATACEAAWSTTDQGLDQLVQRYRAVAMDETVPEEERPMLLNRRWEA